MFTFFREAIGELEHVVWPTSKETNKYMQYTVGIIIIMGAILAFLGFIYREGLTGLRTITPKTTITAPAATGDNAPATQQDLNDLLNGLNLSGTTVNTESGGDVTVEPITSNGTDVTTPTPQATDTSTATTPTAEPTTTDVAPTAAPDTSTPQ